MEPDDMAKRLAEAIEAFTSLPELRRPTYAYFTGKPEYRELLIAAKRYRAETDTSPGAAYAYQPRRRPKG
jgi:hypothetical protein